LAIFGVVGVGVRVVLAKELPFSFNKLGEGKRDPK
jgi:hypothetical protein